jgi:putative selenium metabolism protein SsnA
LKSILLQNALLVDLDPPRVEQASLRVQDGRILSRGYKLPRGEEEVFDCGGAVVLPGLVNGHTHLYSALAVGMPPPPNPPRNFPEILRYVWWRLDQALDEQSILASARVGALEALRCGTTTLIDHHASPNLLDGSLDLIEEGLAEAGLRGVLCYETTDRHGREGRAAGLRENERYLEKCRMRGDGRFAGLIGAHASFTLTDDALDELAAVAARNDAGIHIHVAEDPCDEADARRRGSPSLIDRLEKHGILRPDSLLAHATHLDVGAIERVRANGAAVAHNPRSNMNNAVGYAPTGSLRDRLQLGTDGIGADLFAEARAAWLISRHAQAGLSPDDIIAMLAASARRASQALGIRLGVLERFAAADLVVTDYVPPTPLTADNLAGHLLFALDAAHVRHVMVGGEWVLYDRKPVRVDSAAVAAYAGVIAGRLWSRIGEIPID